jgi:SIS domain
MNEVASMTRHGIALTLALCAIGASADEDCGAALKVAEHWIAEGDGARITFVPRPLPVPVGSHFDIDFVVCGVTPRSGAAVAVDADMPAHRHGMNYRTRVEALNDAEVPSGEARKLPERAREVLESGWEGTARYRYADHLVVTSRGYNLATAQEAALKLMETTYVVAEAFSAADLKHGPIAVIGQDFPVIAIVPPGKTGPGMRSLVENLTEMEAEVVVISDARELTKRAPAGFLVPCPCPEELSPVLYAIPLQLLAHDFSLMKRLDPDSPRGLSKVTETW